MKILKRPEGEPLPDEGAGRGGNALRGALNRRAALFAAIVILVGVVIGLPVGRLVERGSAVSNAKARLDLLKNAVSAGDMSRAPGLRAAGVRVTLTDGSAHEGDAPLTESDGSMLFEALSGEVKHYSLSSGGAEWFRGIYPDGSMAVVVDLPADSVRGDGIGAVIGILAGLFAACIAAFPLRAALFDKAVKEHLERIDGIRQVARSVSAGELTARAEEGEDELGLLSAELNGLSNQLSRSMYTLIVERNRLQSILDGLSEGIIAVDTTGAITHLNPAISVFFEQREVSVGLPDPRMKYVPEEAVWKDFDAVLAGGGSVTRNFEHRDMTLRLTVSPITDELGATAGAVGLISDITQSERLEKTRREYVSNVSHELRTPLTAVRALIEPLKEGMVREEADRMRYYDIILREVMRLSRLINDQLELSRLQSGSVSITKQRMMLDDLIYDVCDRFTGIADEKGIELKLETDLSDCPGVFSNPDRVDEMLVILVDNAIKYTERGEVAVSARWDEEIVYITVRDTGVGIEEKDLPYVFDRFYKVDKAHSGKGSGLGLSIAKELMERMGESIEVKSKKGEGSSFTFTVHRKPTEKAE